MTELATPRWGAHGRDRKAAGLLETLLDHCGTGILDGHWIDIGCGSGGIAAALARRVRSIEGLDPEPWPQWLDFTQTHSNLSFGVAACDSEQLPGTAGSADVVVCNQVYEHVPCPSRLIGNIAAMLKPGGVCYFAGPNLWWPIEPHVFWPFVHWLPRPRAHALMRALGARRPEDLDANLASFATLREWFRAAGLSAENAAATRATVALRQRWPSLARAVSPMLRAAAPFTPLAPAFAFVLRKPA